METSNLESTQFKILVIRLFKELRGITDDLCNNFNKDIEFIKKNQ